MSEKEPRDEQVERFRRLTRGSVLSGGGEQFLPLPSAHVAWGEIGGGVGPFTLADWRAEVLEERERSSRVLESKPLRWMAIGALGILCPDSRFKRRAIWKLNHDYFRDPDTVKREFAIVVVTLSLAAAIGYGVGSTDLHEALKEFSGQQNP